MRHPSAILALCGLAVLCIALVVPNVAHAETSSVLDVVAADVTVGINHSCALTTAGGVKCWGFNNRGQLGNGATADSSEPVAVSTMASGVSAISGGGYHTCALTTAGGVKCWGRNDDGQLGNGSNTDSAVPVAVSGLASGVVAIDAGNDHTCALTSGGGAMCWGNNGGRLGNGSPVDTSTPVAVSGLASGVAAIDAGGAHTCALTTAGGLRCWGRNNYGQLGNGSTTDTTIPVVVSGGLGSGVVTGPNHTCALTQSSGVKCWGYNHNGQLGNGSTTDASTPVAVSGLASGIAAISAGGGNTCALTQTGAVQCWGSNLFGGLGNGSTTQSPLPVGVSSLGSGALAIAVGSGHSCALTTAGGASCWGLNNHGQLGNGSTTESHVPVSVLGLGGEMIFANGFDD